MPWAMIIQAAMSLQAQKEAGKLTDRQFALLQEQLAKVAGVPLPELERVVAQQVGPSELGNIRRDDELRNQQLQALGAYQDIIDAGGMTLDDRVAEEAALSQADSADRRRRAGIMQELASRGQANSGAALVSSLSSAQDAANRGRASGQESAARAQARKLQALEALASGSGRLREQDFGEASRKASAQDEINRWNASAREKAGYYNAGLGQQQFQNAMAKATGQANATNNLAGAYGNEAQGVRNQGAAMGQAAYNAGQGIKWGNDKPYRWGDTSEAGEKPTGYGNDGSPYYGSEDDWENPFK